MLSDKKSSVTPHLDERVIFTLVIVSMLSLLILGFRYIGRDPCTVQLELPGSHFTVGVPVLLKAYSKEGSLFVWNFGDDSAQMQGASISHIYRKPGLYTVTVTANDACEEFQNIQIKDAPFVPNVDLAPKFIIPGTAYINKPVIFKDITPKATSWEWCFEEPGIVDAITKESSHVYHTAGYHTVYLKINGRPELSVTQVINVIDPNPPKIEVAKPRPKEPPITKYVPILVHDKPTEKPINDQLTKKPTEVVPAKTVVKAPPISDDQMAGLISDLIAGRKTMNDFSNYLCNNLDIPVKYNSSDMSFRKLCKELHGIKSKRVKKIDVTLVRNDQTNCIQQMSVWLTKKFVL